MGGLIYNEALLTGPRMPNPEQQRLLAEMQFPDLAEFQNLSAMDRSAVSAG